MTEPARRKPAEAPGGAASTEALPFRAAPHNLEAEQALLGAILVNNEAHDRVSSFLEPHHFYDPLHQQIYETASKLIASGKQATPITLKTFFETAEPIDAGLTVPQYLGRLAANAATIINARDYGRTIHDLATRRGADPDRRGRGQRRLRLARRLPAQGADRGSRDAALRAGRDRQVRPGVPRLQYDAHAGHRDGQQCLPARRAASPASPPGFKDLDGKMGGLQPSDLIILAGRPSHGQDGARHQHRLQCRAGRGPARLPSIPSCGPTILAMTAPSSASSRWRCRPSSSPRASSPSRPASPPRRSAAA